METKIIIPLAILFISAAGFITYQELHPQQEFSNIVDTHTQEQEVVDEINNTQKQEEELTGNTSNEQQEEQTDHTTEEMQDEQVREEMRVHPARVEVIKKGDGEQPIREHERVRIHYTAMLADGTVFDSSEARGEPLEFTVGGGEVIEGLEQGVDKQYVGSELIIYIPGYLGYGVEGIPGTVPPNAELIYEVEILDRYPVE